MSRPTRGRRPERPLSLRAYTRAAALRTARIEAEIFAAHGIVPGTGAGEGEAEPEPPCPEIRAIARLCAQAMDPRRSDAEALSLIRRAVAIGEELRAAADAEDARIAAEIPDPAGRAEFLAIVAEIDAAHAREFRSEFMRGRRSAPRTPNVPGNRPGGD